MTKHYCLWSYGTRWTLDERLPRDYCMRWIADDYRSIGGHP
jgi:hypothetical protein